MTSMQNLQRSARQKGFLAAARGSVAALALAAFGLPAGPETGPHAQSVQGTAPTALPAPDSQAATPAPKQTVQDAAKLLKLATDLKSQVDKTSKDTLSMSVVRTATQIEQLAQKMRESH